ncbi:nucleotide-binding alpha-beta plait domain-containing protein [Tanacetum coccineum]
MQKQARIMKERCMNSFKALKTIFQLLSKLDLCGSNIDYGFKRILIRLFGEKHSTFKDTFFHNMDNLDKQLNKETLHEKDSKSILIYIKSSGTVSGEGNESKNTRNDTDVDGADIRPFYDTESMAEVPNIADYNVFAIEKPHTEPPKFINDTYVMEKDDSNGRYEKELMHPIQNLLGEELACAMLIQIQKLKLYIKTAMLELNQILRANKINFAILAALHHSFSPMDTRAEGKGRIAPVQRRLLIVEVKKRIMQFQNCIDQGLMHGDETHDAYLNRAQEYVDALVAIVEPVKDKDLVMLIVSYLCEEYNSLKTTITAHQSPTAFSELQALLSDHDYMLGKTQLAAQLSALGFLVSPVAPSGPQSFYGANPSNNNNKSNNNNNRDTRANSHVTPDLEAMDHSEAYYGDDALHVGNALQLEMAEVLRSFGSDNGGGNSSLRALEACMVDSFALEKLPELGLYEGFFIEHEHVVMNPTSAGMRHHHLYLYVDSKNLLERVSSSKRRVF